ncbi:hypothetical protein FDB55_04435 [Clostridium botulinum]|uniref:Uncharacterized protein n=2 Tax=Clostridium botulinum TaxID=1491 RepID=A0A6B4TCL1_CLOBO|nr:MULTISPECIES: hypothetical protein [Clostridium]ACD52762.1 conserved hypothetical protein [Clostridium botulinum E3 str. Alaska E43]AJF30445.1 hypothetical protein ST13_12295 [Clostridium botulinum]AJF33508.1 hypothetical protein ST12_12295 [Clostridium botulinum]KAI3346639.1 hypothetical protein CIT18_13660 [Clostridium botulinum]KOM88224.1 hypothetical protein ACP51_08510 [Clostridium botulinum]
MTLLTIKKKIILTLLVVMLISITVATINKHNILQTIAPIDSTKNIDTDLTCDGQNEHIEFITKDNTIDLNISHNNDNTYLSSKINDNVLFSLNNHWSPKIYLYDLSRDIKPEIILQGVKENKSMCYIFSWKDDKFQNLYSSEKNIFGILDSKNNKTPQCFSLSASKGNSSVNSFMIINNEVLDTTNDNCSIPSLNNITNFIKLIETPYELDDLPDLFSTKIDTKDLSILWNLDKENHSYSFQDAFFYDYDWDSYSNSTSLKWRLTFEKNKLKGEEGDKSEVIFYLDSKVEDSNFKIISIKRIK